MSDDNFLKSINQKILKWYAEHRRDLPWRRTRNPYCIWVSEVMLQQTQVGTVIPYYLRFMKRFPTVEALAGSSLHEVLRAWENMGYYSRARHLHTAAGLLMKKTGGEIPDTLEGLLNLPGVGQYTASAILCFAFGKRVPTIDGNVRRVISRVFSIREPVNETETKNRIHSFAGAVLPERDPSGFNQGLMDLGATICIPRKPLCPVCPINKSCLAFRQGLQDVLPVTKKRGPLPHREMTAGIIRDERERILIVQRPPRGLLGGLWKFPGGEKGEEADLAEALQASVQREVGLRVKAKETMISLKHAYTHFRITLTAFRCDWEGGSPGSLGCENVAWVPEDALSEYPFSRADRKIIEIL